MYDEDAILVYRSSGNYIINNNISSSIRGITISRFSRNNVIQANTVSSSRQGILVAISSDDNLVVNNEVSGNKVGITVYKSSGNNIYGNSFMRNSEQSYDDGDNFWSMENEGNYWSDYRREGDTAYDIAPAGMDEYPLTKSVPVVPVEVPEPASLTFREICIPPRQAIKEEVKLENTEILMENSYWIPKGGKLILENVTLRSYKAAASPYEIKVEGGTLIISNSRIIAPETGIAPISITAEKDSTLVIKYSEFHHIDGGWGVEGAAIPIKCEGAVIEGNIINDSRKGIYISEVASSARVVNNTVEGCLEAVWSGNPFAGHEIEGNTVHDPVPVERVSGFWRMIAVNTWRLLLYWMKDPRVIAGLIAIVAIIAGGILFRRHRRKERAAAG
jgi:parallel beta-helix repeat protein